ncbi:MAG: PilZ domain-containing protein [Thiogranum sp.]|nr:PilZ domain-containing protein [Thiogranum sp.]
MREQRQHPRTSFTARVKIMHPDLVDNSYPTRDVAQGGVFLYCGDEIRLPAGTEVIVQDDEILEDPPQVKARIVRIDSDGIALMFIED